MGEVEIRKKILDLVKKYYRVKHASKSFIPGETYIPPSGKVFDENELINLVDSSLEFWLTASRYANQFESKLAEFIGAKHTLFTCSGSSANLLALASLTSPKLGDKRLGPGDEVITVAASFPTTVNPIIQQGLVPVFLDIEIGTYNIDASKLEDVISDRTKAIMIAHTLGNPFDLSKVLSIAEEHDLFVIEDCCDALGSKYKGKYVGTFGDLATLSFFPAHHITTGEGGAVITDNSELKKIVQSFRDWGRDCWCESGSDDTCGKRFEWQLGDLPYGYDHKYIYSHIGYNLKALDLQAAIGLAQLQKLSYFIERRKENFERLYDGLKEHENYLILPKWLPESEPSWFGFPISVRDNAPFSRNELVEFLEKNKIATRMLFAGNIVKQPAYKNVKYRVFDSLENTNFVMNNTFWTGVYPEINSEKIDYMLEIFSEFFKKR